MSFSSEVKEELAKQFGRSRHCQIAELAGILELEGMLDEEGKLVVSNENSLLQTKYGLGVWVTILALILGLLTSASTALQFYRKLTAKKEKDNDTPKPPRGYGDHI